MSQMCYFSTKVRLYVYLFSVTLKYLLVVLHVSQRVRLGKVICLKYSIPVIFITTVHDLNNQVEIIFCVNFFISVLLFEVD